MTTTENRCGECDGRRGCAACLTERTNNRCHDRPHTHDGPCEVTIRDRMRGGDATMTAYRDGWVARISGEPQWLYWRDTVQMGRADESEIRRFEVQA